ncbi:MAG: glycoside hydrolase family 28 [Bacteroidetes bacterium]|nr:glycoside hydrolase family 28 [Bacteroidota bacterium]
MIKKLLLIIILSAYSLHGFSQKKTLNIVDFGAIADGKTKNTIAIQNAIDKANKMGGAIVLIPAGNFLTGIIQLKSNVELHLDADAILLASTSRIDYGPRNANALISAKGQHHISITGKGVIAGQSEALLKDIYVMLNAGTLIDASWKTVNPWHQMRTDESSRPKLLDFSYCDNIQIKEITLKDGLCWIQNYVNCSNVIIDNIKVISNSYWNNDGLDITDSENVRITNCNINAADDGICLKSEERHLGCKNIMISNCVVRSSANGVKFGTASYGGFKNITVKDITVFDTYRSAIALEAVDGGILEDVNVQNIKATNTGNAILIRLGHRNKDSLVSCLRNVYIGNVTVFVPAGKPDKGYNMEGPLLSYPHNVIPSSITGLPGHPVQNVTLENIKITYEGGGSKDIACFPMDSLTNITENPAGYPEFSMFGELPVWGFYVRHVKGLTMKNIQLSYQKEDFRSACAFDDVQGLNINKMEIPTAKTLPIVVFNNITDLTIEKLQFPVENDKAILIQKK